MKPIELKDSNLNGEVREYNNTDLRLAIKAIDKLNSEFRDGKIKIINIFNQTSEENLQNDELNLIRCETVSSENKLRIFTSHYIGTYRTNIEDGRNVQINIRPRFGDSVFNHLLSFASELYISDEGKASINEEEGYALWILAILWKAAFDKAVITNHIPHEYVICEENLPYLKGKLHFSEHLRKNLVYQNRMFCRYSKLTANSTINRTIRYTYEILQKLLLGKLIADLAGYDDKLAAFGVSRSVVNPDEIEKIVYTRMTENYKMLMYVSRMIINYHLLSSSMEENEQEGFAFFIDVSQIWENYIMNILRRNLPERYTVISPNYGGKEHYLLENSIREIKPDILIYEGDKLVAVLDAKYKDYKNFGAIEKGGISREDLYQMTSYLWHFEHKKVEDGLIGLFIAPLPVKWDELQEREINDYEKNIYSYAYHENIRIGLINLRLLKNDENEKLPGEKGRRDLKMIISEYESQFVKKLKKLLCG